VLDSLFFLNLNRDARLGLEELDFGIAGTDLVFEPGA
jgi:hypothetical protein